MTHDPGPSDGLNAEQQQALHAILAQHTDEAGALLPILHAVQDQFGHIPRAAIPVIAQHQNLSRAEVQGVVSYYHHFRSAPAARHVLQICRAEACQSMGADALMAHAQLRLGCEPHASSADGAFTLEPAFCLGLCASSPALMLGEQLHARVTPARLDALLAEARSAA